jgi:UDP:flavonoid glycosyltransferase YjiC (YdhE family)
VQRLRPVPFDAAAGEDVPAWLESLGPKPTIYVTMGTVFNEALPLFARSSPACVSGRLT